MERRAAITGEETEVIDFIKRIMKKSDGAIAVHRLKIQLEALPKAMKSIIGGITNKQLSEFLIKHSEHFVVRFGVAYIGLNDPSVQYGRVFTDVCGKFESKRKIRLLEDNSFAFVTKVTANAGKFEIGDFVKCNVNKGAGQLMASHLRPIPAQEVASTSIKSSNDEKTRESGKKTREPGKKKRGKKNKKSTGSPNGPKGVVNTEIDYKNAENLVNVAGSVVKLTHQNGRLRFGDDNYAGEVCFVIDDYYEEEKKVLNLEWYLKVGDEVLFDAILEEGIRWKVLVVWKGIRPQITTIIDKKRTLEEYLERNNPLISMDFCLDVHGDVPIVTVGGAKASKKGNLVAKSGTKPTNCQETGTKPKCERDFEKTGSQTEKSDGLVVKSYRDALCESLVKKSEVRSVDRTYGSMDDVESGGSTNDFVKNRVTTSNVDCGVFREIQTGTDVQVVLKRPMYNEVAQKSKDEAKKCSTGDDQQVSGDNDNNCCKCAML